MDKDTQYSAIYFPLSMVEDREKTWFALQNIDCNYSKFLQLLIKQLFSIAKFIFTNNKNYRHYHWLLVIKDIKNNETYATKNTVDILKKGNKNEIKTISETI